MITRGVPFTSIIYFLPEGTLDIFFFGGGGGGGGYGDRVFVLFIDVLFLVVCSVFILFRILVVFRFSFNLLLPCILMSHVLVCLCVY